MINYLDKFKLKGKTAVVVGGAGLIGGEIVSALAQAGARVVIVDVNQAKGKKLVKQLKAKKYAVEFYLLDVTKLKVLPPALDKLVKKYKRVDVWINTHYPRTADWGNKPEDVSVEAWQKNVDMHLNSYALTAKLIAEHMKKKGGSIINLGSTYGVVGADFSVYKNTKMTNAIAYAAIKGGITNLGRYMASYYGKYNIRVNTVCPGGIFDNQNKVFLQNYNERTPLKRMGEVSEVAGVVLFLATEAASYITGATIMVDGGWTAI